MTAEDVRGPAILLGAMGEPGCAAIVAGYRGVPSGCTAAPTHMCTRWYPGPRHGHRVAVCAAHLAAVDDPHR